MDRRRLGGWGGAVPVPARERRDAARPAGEDAGGPRVDRFACLHGFTITFPTLFTPSSVNQMLPSGPCTMRCMIVCVEGTL